MMESNYFFIKKVYIKTRSKKKNVFVMFYNIARNEEFQFI